MAERNQSPTQIGSKRKVEGLAGPSLLTDASRGRRFLDAIMVEPEWLEASTHPGLRFLFRGIPHPVIGDTSVDIIIREADWNFWKACIAELEDPDPQKIRKRVAVVGSPGVGKSTTALFIIRRLLQMKKTVVYRMKGTAGNYVIFNPNNGSGSISPVVVTELPGSTPETEITPLTNRETYFIIDPGVTKTNCNPDPDVKAKVLIVASPDERHWGGNTFPKDQPGWPGGLYRYFPPWSLQELQSAGSLLLPPLASEQIEQMFSIFGGIPRQVFSPSYSKQNSKILEKKVAALSETHAKSLVSGRLNVHANFGADQPQGGIAIFTPTDDYEDVVVSLASVSVGNWVRSHFLGAVWADLALYPTPTAWQLLESYSMEAMMKTNQYTARHCVGKSNKLYAQTFALELGGCTSKSFQYECSPAVKDGSDNALFYSSNRQHPLYDMIFKRDSTFYAIQVTVGRNHDAERAQIETLAQLLQIGSGARELKLIYAVHEALFDVFVTNPVQPMSPPGVSIYHLSLRQNL